LGSNVSITSPNLGAVVLQHSGGFITLTATVTQQATLNLTNGGGMVFQTTGTGSIILDGGTFTTERVHPIAFFNPSVPNENDLFGPANGFIHASEDLAINSRFAQVDVRKGAMLVVESTPHSLRVLACSGPADVVVHVN